MSKLRSPFKFGSLLLPNNVFYAPLAGCSDFPFRKMSCKYRPGLVFCEMVKMNALVRHETTTYQLLEYSHDMHPIGAQICGSKPELAGPSAKIIEELGFDEIDLNCGCPVDKITKDGSGSGLLKNPEKIGEIISNMIAAVNIPVSVKIRAGWDDAHINAVEITRIAEKAGATAIAIHGRTRAQGYKGSADWDIIRECKKASKDILIIGNGDIFSPDNALEIFNRTDCDAILISRGSMGQPWLVEDIFRTLENFGRERTLDEVKENILEHFSEIILHRPEKKAILDFRRVGCWYLKRFDGMKEVRLELNRIKSTKEAFAIIEKGFGKESCR